MTSERGLAFRCSPQGAIVDVLVDGVGLDSPTLIADVVTATSISDALTLLHESSRSLVTAPIELGVVDGGATTSLWWIGATEGEHVVLVGAPDQALLGRTLDAIAEDIEPATLTELHARRSAAPLANNDDDVLLELSRTNNDLIRLHRELAQAKARLDALNERKDEILAMVAHDLRNPLGSIGGFAQALERMVGNDLEPAATRMLERIAALSGQMVDMVDDLLDASALEHGRVTLDIEPVDVRMLVRRTIDMYEATASHKDLTFSVACDCADPQISGDERRLLQVFDNLVSNAVKYSPMGVGGVIAIHCGCAEQEVEVTIRDHGAGIPLDEHHLVFEPYARTSVQPTGAERSTGLGLPISRSIVEAHHGTITFTSAPGQGSAFTVTLPRVQAAVETPEV